MIDGEKEATYNYHANITNDGVNSGNHDYELSPGVGNEFEIDFGKFVNDDAVNRTGFADILDGTGGNVLAEMVSSTTLAAAEKMTFPHSPTTGQSGASDQGVAAGARLILSGPMTLLVRIASIAVSEDSAFGISGRISGGIPTVTLTSPTGATETVDTNAVV